MVASWLFPGFLVVVVKRLSQGHAAAWINVDQQLSLPLSFRAAPPQMPTINSFRAADYAVLGVAGGKNKREARLIKPTSSVQGFATNNLCLRLSQ